MSPLQNTGKLFCSLRFDSFAAQAAAVFDPLLRNKPYVVVRQESESHKVLVWDVSTAARVRGVACGMPLLQARKICAGMAVVACDEEHHAVLRRELETVLLDYTPDVRVSRSGACLLDLSRTPAARGGLPEGIAARMQNDIVCRTGLDAPAAGLAPSRFLAVLLARAAPAGGVRSGQSGVLAGMETRLLPALSRECRARLRKYGLTHLGQIGCIGRSELVARFGGEGERLYAMARGIDGGAGRASAAPLSAETVLDRDTGDGDLLRQYLHRTVDRFCHAARLSCRTAVRVRLVIKYTDGKRAQATVDCASLCGDYAALVRRVEPVFEGLHSRRVGLRSIALNGQRPEAASGQTDLFAGEREYRQERLGASIVRLREARGFNAVFTGGDYGAYVKERQYG